MLFAPESLIGYGVLALGLVSLWLACRSKKNSSKYVICFIHSQEPVEGISAQALFLQEPPFLGLGDGSFAIPALFVYDKRTKRKRGSP